MPELEEKAKATIRLLKEIGIDEQLVKNATKTSKYGKSGVEERLWEVRTIIYEIITQSRTSTANDAWILAWTKGLADGYCYKPNELSTPNGMKKTPPYSQALRTSRYNTLSNLTQKEITNSTNSLIKKLSHYTNREKVEYILINGTPGRKQRKHI